MEILGGNRLINFRLYAITDQSSCYPTPLLEQIQYLLDLGVPAIQLREKELSDEDFRRLADLTQRMMVDYPTHFFINSRWQLAAKMRVDGVHLPAQLTNQIRIAKSAGLLVGSSAHNLAEAQQQAAEGADFITYSPIFPTSSKPGHTVGLCALAQVSEMIDIPVFALGGIKPRNIVSCQRVGAFGVAVMSGMMADQLVIQSYLKEMENFG
ncbi:thiamine phosphate synthase [Candidatus Poribacteria bacterium]|nr:thiamine phosphate synthase [Candidatus Poribacteria bacterium]MCH2574974.1 thiamine phosphate synthase [Candidatus Poribacteria bacterium]